MWKRRTAPLMVGVACLAPALASAQTVLKQRDLPVKITKSGSYILQSNLKVTDPTVDAILVTANDVTIDLNGFAIEGPPMGPTSDGSAIESLGATNVVVRNGHIRGFWEADAACIHLTGNGSRVEDVHVNACGGIAIYVEGVVTRCEVTDSGSGIGVGPGSIVADNHLKGNYGFSIHTNTPGVSAEGVRAGGVTITRNTVEVPWGGICIGSPGANRIEGNTCHGGSNGLNLTDGANYYANNLIYGAYYPLTDAGAPNIDGGSIDPSLSNVIVPLQQ